MRFFGLNGAALAARGDRPVDLAETTLPLAARDAGVKLGESALKRFLRLCFSFINPAGQEIAITDLSVCV